MTIEQTRIPLKLPPLDLHTKLVVDVLRLWRRDEPRMEDADA